MKKESLPRPPIALLDLATGYQRAKTLFALVEFAVPTLLAKGSLTLEEIARALRIHQVAADRFLNACVALGLLERNANRFRNTQLAENFLVKGKRTYLGDQLLNYDRTSYPLWIELVRKLRSWEPGVTDDETPQPEDQGATSMRAQHNLALLIGHALSSIYDFSRHRKMLDLGGGTGAMSLAICEMHDELRAIIFELPEIAEVARQFIRESDCAARIEIQTGNFKEDDLPTGFDVALLANLLSVASAETNQKLFREIYRKLPAEGAIILSGWILDDARTSPLIPVLFCLEDISWRAPDVERSVSTYCAWLTAAGFVNLEHRDVATPTSIIIGRKK
jgi:SAM-dependent methyltransferase